MLLPQDKENGLVISVDMLIEQVEVNTTEYAWPLQSDKAWLKV